MGIAPLFTTAPRVKIKIGGNSIAFAIGMNINVSVAVQPVQVIGKFGPISLEPTMYNIVTGTMQIIRLISTQDMANVSALLQKASAAGVLDEQAIPPTAAVNSEGEQVQQVKDATTIIGDSNNPIAQNALIRHMDPRSVLLSTTFDMQLYMRIPDATIAAVKTAMTTGDVAPGALNLNDPKSPVLKEVAWMTIQDCRITSRNINISVGQLVNEPVSFQGLMLTSKDAAGNNMMFQDTGVGSATT